MAGKLKWWEAAEVIGVTDQTMRSQRQRDGEYGYDGLFDRRRKKKTVADCRFTPISAGRGGVDFGTSALGSIAGLDLE